MKKTINFIIWFICHSYNNIHITKTYYTELKYYDYKVYKLYYLCSLIPVWINIDNFNSLDKKKYSSYIMNSKTLTENLIYK